MTARTLTVGSATLPARAAQHPRSAPARRRRSIITIHILGQVALGFLVSVPQILAAILTCAVIEVAITF